MAQKHILIIAGPNGAGKSTFASEHLMEDFGMEVFVNADQIAAELKPSQPEAVAVEAGRPMLKQAHGMMVLEEGGNFNDR